MSYGTLESLRFEHNAWLQTHASLLISWEEESAEKRICRWVQDRASAGGGGSAGSPSPQTSIRVLQKDQSFNDDQNLDFHSEAQCVGGWVGLGEWVGGRVDGPQDGPTDKTAVQAV